MPDIRPSVVLAVLIGVAFGSYLILAGRTHEQKAVPMAGPLSPVNRAEREIVGIPIQPPDVRLKVGGTNTETEHENDADFGKPLNAGAVSGYVIDVKTKQPIADVPIITARSFGEEKSGRDGFFKIVGFPPGTYKLEVASPGYLATGPVTFTILDGEETTGVLVPATPGGTLEGRVTCGGEPIAGGKVEVIPMSADSPALSETTPRPLSIWATTNEQGQYRIEGLPPLESSVVRFTMQPGEQNQVEGTGYAEIAGGEITRLNFDFPGTGGYCRIRGYLLGFDPKAANSDLPGVRITSRYGNNFSATSGYYAPVDSTGHFETQNLPAGLHELTISMPGYRSMAPDCQKRRMIRSNGGKTYEIELDLGGAPKIVGFAGHNAGGVAAEVFVLTGDTWNEVEAGGPLRELVPPDSGVRTDPDGIFAIESVAFHLFDDLVVVAQDDSGELAFERLRSPSACSDASVILWFEP